jgi:hypothetical protein
MRKMEKIATLDGQTQQLRQENEDLAGLAGKLREQVRGADYSTGNLANLSHQTGARPTPILS